MKKNENIFKKVGKLIVGNWQYKLMAVLMGVMLWLVVGYML